MGREVQRGGGAPLPTAVTHIPVADPPAVSASLAAHPPAAKSRESPASRFMSPSATPPHGVGPPDSDAARHGAPPGQAQNGPSGEIARAG